MLPRGPGVLEDMGVEGLSLVGAGEAFTGDAADPTLLGASKASSTNSSPRGSGGWDGLGGRSEAAGTEGRDLDLGFCKDYPMALVAVRTKRACLTSHVLLRCRLKDLVVVECSPQRVLDPLYPLEQWSAGLHLRQPEHHPQASARPWLLAFSSSLVCQPLSQAELPKLLWYLWPSYRLAAAGRHFDQGLRWKAALEAVIYLPALYASEEMV